VSVTEKVQGMYQVWTKRTNTSELLLKSRKWRDDVETGEVMLPWDELGGFLPTGQVAPGIEAA